jgi:hypothetical protein
MTRTRKQPNDGNRPDPSLTPMIYRDLARECDELTARATTHYPHREGRGASREDLFRSFLTKRLPETVSIGKGHIQDSHGTTTSEFDIVLYDPMARMIIAAGTNERAVFPVESVIAAIEIRTKIDKSALIDTNAKATELASLKRYYTPTCLADEFYDADSLNDIKGGLPGSSWSPFHPGFPSIYVALVGFQAVSVPSLRKYLPAMGNGVELILALGSYVALRLGRNGGEYEILPIGLHGLAMLILRLMDRIQRNRQSTHFFDWDFDKYFLIPDEEDDA